MPISSSGGIAAGVTLPPGALANLKADGSTDNMPLLKDAIAEAVANGLNYLFVPPGTYTFLAKRLTADRVILPENFHLYGIPGATVFKVLASSYTGLTTGQAVGILVVRNGSRVSGLVYDGNKANVNSGNITDYGGNFINRYDDTVTDVVLEDLEMKNNPGGSAYESFCIQTGFQSKRWKFYRVWAHDNNGTGISINGDMMDEYDTPGAGLASDMDVIDCRGTDNYWMGMTVYGARDIRIRNFVGTGNGNAAISGGNGVNIEWASNVTVEGGLFELNQGAGVGGYGCVEKIYISGSATLRNNNQLNASNFGEIAFRTGSWYTGPSATNFAGGIQSLYIGPDVSVTPKTSGWKTHLMIAYNTNANWVFGVATGGSYPATVGTHPTEIVVRARNADSWKIVTDGTGITGVKVEDFSPCAISFPDVLPAGPNWAPPLGSWTAATMSVALAAGGFNQGRYRLTSGSAAGTYAGAAVNLVCQRWMPAGQKFLVRIKYRNNSADVGWNFAIRPAGYDSSGTGARQFNLNLYALDTSWRTAEMVVTMPETSIAQPRFYYCGSNASATLDVEFSMVPIGAPAMQSVVVGGIKNTYLASGSPIDEDYEIGDRIWIPGGDLRVTAAGSYGAVSGSVTITISSGQNQGTLSSATDETLRPGKWVTIPGVTGAKLIRYRSGATISFSAAVDATATTQVCTISNPTTAAG